jgi:VanZ family protein
VNQAGLFCKYWMPVGMWMLLIFGASSDTLSSAHTSRIIGPIIRWLTPNISEGALGSLVFRVRKCAHVTEYAVLAWLFWRARRKPVTADLRPWCWSEFWIALGLVTLYGASDEFHQLFVQTRVASVWDVLIDACGGALGLMLLWSFGRWRKQW